MIACTPRSLVARGDSRSGSRPPRAQSGCHTASHTNAFADVVIRTGRLRWSTDTHHVAGVVPFTASTTASGRSTDVRDALWWRFGCPPASARVGAISVSGSQMYSRVVPVATVARACLSAADKPKAGAKPPPTARTETKGHGRTETRVGVVVAAKGLAEHHEFPGLKAFGRVTATRESDGEVTTDVRIFALSKKLSPAKLLETVRAHWQIGNALHWQLDVSFGADAARNRRDHGPANIAVLRRRALDVARLDPAKGSLTTKLKSAGWNHDIMLEMLGRMSHLR